MEDLFTAGHGQAMFSVLKRRFGERVLRGRVRGVYGYYCISGNGINLPNLETLFTAHCLFTAGHGQAMFVVLKRRFGGRVLRGRVRDVYGYYCMPGSGINLPNLETLFTARGLFTA